MVLFKSLILVYLPLTLKILRFTSIAYISASYKNLADCRRVFVFLGFLFSNLVLILIHYTDATKNKMVNMFEGYISKEYFSKL